MWTILKFDKKKLELLKTDLRQKIGNDFEIYIPKIQIQKYKNNKLKNIELNLLGDYLLFFHKGFKNNKSLSILKSSRGLKYFLEGFIESQNDIREFINRCRETECDNGFLSKNFFNLYLNKKCRFSSGPFTNKIFEIINLQKNKINILLGNVKTSVKKEDFLFYPV